MRIAACQVDSIQGDVSAITNDVLALAREAKDRGADLAVFPELTLAGPGIDAPAHGALESRIDAALDELAREATLPLIIGHARWSGASGERMSTASYVRDGSAQTLSCARGGVGFAAADRIRLGSTEIAVCIGDPVRAASIAGAEAVLVLDASAWDVDAFGRRNASASMIARDAGAMVLRVQRAGAHDGIIYGGRSTSTGIDGLIAHEALAFDRDVLVVDLADGSSSRHEKARDELADVWHALVTGIERYVTSVTAAGVVIGMSGGLDSALVAALAVDALGPERVRGITMPSRYSSDATRGDAVAQARALGIPIAELPIEPVVRVLTDTLGTSITPSAPAIVFDNLQARARGVLLMATSNATGDLVLATSNKSESAVGYATLYGDMVGALSPLKDVYKTHAYALARWRNERARRDGDEPRIPPSVIERPPSAELREDQLDSDALPPYVVLDPIVDLLLTGASVEDVVAAGFEPADVLLVRGLIDRSEFKRRQSAPGIRVSQTAFGFDVALPISHRFDGRAQTSSAVAP